MRLPLFLALFALPAFAEGTPNPIPTNPSPTSLNMANLSPTTGRPGSAARLIEAHRLYQLGKSAQDPLLILAAARLMQGVTLREVTRTVAEPVPTDPDADKAPKGQPEDPGPVLPAAPDSKVVPDPARSAPLPGALNPSILMAEARAMVPNRSVLRDVIASAETETPPPGSVALITSLVQEAGGNTTFTLPMAGDSYGEIGLLRLSPSLTADPALTGHLGMTVTDGAGNLVCADVSATSDALCGVVPKETGTFRVTVTNDGTAPASYLLITN